MPRSLLGLVLILAAPAWAANSVFVAGAFVGTWGASFPPWIPQVIGPIIFAETSDAAGAALMDQLGGPGTAARFCPPASEKREFYSGTYDYAPRGRVAACTNGTTLVGAYKDNSGGGFGTIHITETNPGAVPSWAGTFTDANGDRGNMRGVYQGGGIGAPLARDPNVMPPTGGGGPPTFTGCRFKRRNRHVHLHHPAFYSKLGQMFLGLDPLDLNVRVIKEDEPVGSGLSVSVSASDTAFPGEDGLPQSSSSVEQTGSDGVATFIINPAVPDPTNTTKFTAKVTIDGAEHECMSTVVTGLGVEYKPYLSKVDEIAIDLEQLARGLSKPSERKELAAAEPAKAEPKPGNAQLALSRIPLVFEENRGQAEASVDYVARVSGTGLLVGPQGVTLQADPTNPDGPVNMRIVDGNKAAEARVLRRLSGKSHYLLGSDPKGWIRGIGQAAKVQFDAVYPGIDVVYYGNQRRLEYDFVVAPEADPGQIRLHFGEELPASVDESGDLVLDGGYMEVKLKKPYIYQEAEGEHTVIAGGYRVDPSGNVAFDIGEYDPLQTLVIDPVLEFSTFLGGAAEDVITDMTLDAAGNIYVAGTTTSVGLATEEALKTVNQRGGVGESDGFVAKLDPSGKQLLYLTYVGGRKDDSPFGVVVDSQGNVLVTGTTTSEDFPTVAAIQDKLGDQFGFGGMDAFAFKLNSQGSALVYSTFLGGAALELEGEIDVDSQGNAYIVSSTTSKDLPVVNAVQPVRAGAAAFGPDAFVAKLSPTGQAIYVTYLGGAAEDWGFGIAADSSGNAWVVGTTKSTDFQSVNSFQNVNQGGFDVFLTKISSNGQVLMSSGFLGGASDEMGRDVALDGAGNVYVTGSTGSAEFPLQGAAQSESMNEDGLAQDAFVAKLSPDGTNLLYSTFYGGSGTELSHGIAVGADGSAYISGETDSTDLPLKGAFQTVNGGRYDAFVAKLNPAGDEIDYATYLGGSSDEGAPSLAVDAGGKVVTAGIVYSSDFPVTIGAFQTSPASEMESFVAKLAPGDPPPAVVSISGASFVRTYGLAPDSFATAFGEGLAAALEVDSDMPTTLGGVTVTITDSNGAVHQARIYIVAPTQINYLIPPGVAPGLAAIAVSRDGQVVATETVRISAVAPGIFSAASTGAGVAAAVFLRADPDGTRTNGVIFDATISAIPLDLGPEGAELYVFLFGTGLRNFTGEVTVTIDGIPVPFAGPVAQGQFDGLDQLNLGPLPRSLAGRGEVEIVITVDGKKANVVTVAIL